MFHGLRQNFTVSLAARCSEEEKKDYLRLITAGMCALPMGKGYNEEDYSQTRSGVPVANKLMNSLMEK